MEKLWCLLTILSDYAHKYYFSLQGAGTQYIHFCVNDLAYVLEEERFDSSSHKIQA